MLAQYGRILWKIRSKFLGVIGSIMLIASAQFDSDVVLETTVLVSRRLEDKE